MKFGKRRRDKPGPGELTKDMADALMQEMSDAGINVSFGETPIRSVDDLAHASGLTADQLLNPPQSPGPELKPGDTVRLRGQRIRGSLDQLLPDGRWVVAWADLTTSW